MRQADDLTDADFTEEEIKLAQILFEEMKKFNPEINLVARQFDGQLYVHIDGYFDLRSITKNLKIRIPL